MNKKPFHVSLVVFPECDPSIVYGVFDTLWAAGRDFEALSDALPLFEPRIVSSDNGPIKLVTGVSILPQDNVDDLERTDVVFVPNVVVTKPEHLRALDRKLLDWIKRMHLNGSQVYAACGGSLVLAEAGLLEGQQATTHWTYAPLFRQQFPGTTLHVERLLVQTGNGHSIACAGGASSWQDLALLLVAKHGGTPKRSGCRSCFSINGIATDSFPMRAWFKTSITATPSSSSLRSGLPCITIGRMLLQDL
jgi:transcriptional regulator GlxA family with amidase domain